MDNRNYKRLGDYVHEVDERNTDLSIKKLVGVNLQKEFMPSVANIIGTDLSRYKVVRYNQFGLKLMSVERDRKMPISLMKEEEPCIISSAYYVFEVNDEDILLPDYLFLQIKQPEFDRRLWFSTGGDVRGGATWDNLANMPILVPSIDEQKEIVAQHQAIEKRIKNNEMLIDRLEETINTLYNKMFVDGVDNESLPIGWKECQLKDVADFYYGKMPDSKKLVEKGYPVYSGYTITKYYTEYSIEEPTIVVIARGDAGSGEIRMSPARCFLSNLAIGTTLHNPTHKFYLYYYLKSKDTSVLRTGSAQAQVTINTLEQFDIVMPPDELCQQFESFVSPIVAYERMLADENGCLDGIKNNLRLS